MNNKSQGGQALLLILLSVGVIITIGLSVVSKSVTDLSTTQKDEESLRAFSAAEAGVEETLKTQISVLPKGSTFLSDVSVGNTGKFTSISNSFPSNTSEYAYPVDLLSGDLAIVWFSSHVANNALSCSGAGNPCYTGNSINLCWGKTGVSVSSQPAISGAVVFADPVSGSIKYALATFDPVASRRNNNKFSGNITTDTNNGACTIGSLRFANRATVDFLALGIPNSVPASGRLKGMVTRVYYNSEPTIIGVRAVGSALPLQGRQIESTGSSGQSTRKVQVYALYPEIPNVFHGALFSPPGILKN